MGASDWAGRMCQELETRFDICSDRALRFTTLVRLFVSGEGYEGVIGDSGSEQHRELQDRLIDRLDESLADQPGDTVEERWNNLMDELDLQADAEQSVYLIPWSEHDAEDWSEPGVTRTRPE